MDPSDLVPELREAGVSVTLLGAAHRRALPAHVGGVAFEMLRFRPQVTQAHLLFSTLAVGFAPRPLGGRRVATFHNMGKFGDGKTLTGEVMRSLLGWVARSRFDLLTAVSPRAAESNRSFLDLGRTPTTIPNPIQSDELQRKAPPSRAVARASLPISTGKQIVVVVAKFTPEKGHDVLFQAIAMIDPTRRPLVVLVGSGPLHDELRHLASQLGLDSAILWLGELPAIDVLRWMKAGDLLVLPSRSEGLPMTILEAMSLGTPIVATAVGGVGWCIGDAGWVVPAESPEALVGAINEALGDQKERDRRCRMALTEQLPRFELGAVLQMWADLLNAPSHAAPA